MNTVKYQGRDDQSTNIDKILTVALYLSVWQADDESTSSAPFDPTSL